MEERTTTPGTRSRAPLTRMSGMMVCLVSMLGACAGRGPVPGDLAFIEERRQQEIARCNEIADPVWRAACLEWEAASLNNTLDAFESIHASGSGRDAEKWSSQRAEIAIEVGHAFQLYEFVSRANSDPRMRRAGESLDMQVWMDSYSLKMRADALLANARWINGYTDRVQQEFYEGLPATLDELRQSRGSLYERLVMAGITPSAHDGPSQPASGL